MGGERAKQKSSSWTPCSRLLPTLERAVPPSLQPLCRAGLSTQIHTHSRGFFANHWKHFDVVLYRLIRVCLPLFPGYFPRTWGGVISPYWWAFWWSLIFTKGAFICYAYSHAFLCDRSLDVGLLVNPILIDFVTCLSRGCANLCSHWRYVGAPPVRSLSGTWYDQSFTFPTLLDKKK